MQIHLLVEPHFLPIPSTIKVLNNWGTLNVINHQNGQFTKGIHMMVEGTDEAIKNWLKDYDGIWLGNSHPMLQSFSIHHIR